MIEISVVIPTCNRRERVVGLLNDLAKSIQPLKEIIVVDSSDDAIEKDLTTVPSPYGLRYLRSKKSVCAQRNRGISSAEGNWIFLCDDDIEVPADYLVKLAKHAHEHPEAGAVTGLIRQREGGEWVDQYPLTSSVEFLWRHIFQLGIWGEIRCRGLAVDWLIEGYRKRGNHLSKAGWPVVTEVKGEYFRTPVYGLGASLVRRDWLLRSPYDEALDAHGLGDNYGVSVGFPHEGIHVVNGAFVYHHQEKINRLPEATAYARRLRALDYFIRSRKELAAVGRGWFFWSLVGAAVLHGASGNLEVSAATIATLVGLLGGERSVSC
jgi:glycosyltransferase involved in cell wall biosynthesis